MYLAPSHTEMTFNRELQISLLSISCVAIAVVNLVCIIVIVNSTKLRRKPPTILIGNLIGTHMIQGICVLPLYILRIKNPALVAICDGFYFTYMLTFYSATISVFLLSLDRVLAVILLNSYDKYVTMNNVIKVTVIAWSYIFALCLMPFFKLERSKALKHSICTYLQPRAWTIFMLTVNALIPYVFIVIGYVYVRVKLKKLSAYFAAAEVTKDGDQRERKKRERRTKKFKKRSKITKLTFLIVFTYGVTWAPSIIYYLVQHICTSCIPDKYYQSELKDILSFLMKYINFFDAMIAPVLYCYFHDEFRHEFKRIILRKEKTISTSSFISDSNAVSTMSTNTFALKETTSIRSN
ncbi:5-hydroxytryptamine receptor 1D-like [Clytia hemisphaerica]|uniref:G-protein coupled receptors family 1 profile domain-containing protein n=1 Tax=Clytia hemisphaerica TaxID=252671 RepID=A0A7M5VG61_9CNID